MRIEQLDLKAFGPFTDKVLTFNEGNFHIIYGPNEAGKSSALRALTALLYGIDSRTTDSHVHINKALRIGGILSNANGQQLDIVRRKGNSKTLLTPEGQTLDEQILTPYLQGVSHELFKTLFGIDHQALVQGGQDILEQRGDAGQILFSAASGSQALHDLFDSLESDAQDLFKSGGSRPKINSDIKALSDIEKSIKSTSLATSHWDQHQKSLEQSGNELEQLNKELEECRTQINRLQRIQRVLPSLAKRRELLKQLDQFPDVVVLPDHFSESRRNAEGELDKAHGSLTRLTELNHRLQEDLDDLSVNTDLLENKDSIQALHARLASFRNDSAEKPGIEAQEKQLIADATTLLKQIRPDLDWQELETLRPILSRRAAVNDLVSQRPALQSTLEQTQTQLRQKQQRLQQVQSELDEMASVGNTTSLHQQISASKSLGGLGKTIENTRDKLDNLNAQCTMELSRLNFWEGSVDQVATLAVPEREAIDQFGEEYDKLAARIQEIQRDQEKNTSVLRETKQALTEIANVGQVATEQAMFDMREERNTLWKLLRRQWLHQEKVDVESARLIGENTTLHDAFESRQTQADDMADRLRREADRVLKLATLQSKLEAEQAHEQTLDSLMQEVQSNKVSLDARWQALWSGCQIAPGTARQMRSWLDKFESLRTQVESSLELGNELYRHEQKSAEHIGLLADQLQSLGQSLSSSGDLESMLSASEAIAKELDELVTSRKALNKELSDLKGEIGRLEGEEKIAKQKLDQWTISWSTLLQELALNDALQPAEMGELADNIRTLFDKKAEIERAQIHLAKIENNSLAFREEVASMVNTVATEHSELPAADAVVKLNALLTEHSTKRAAQEQLQQQIKETNEELLSCKELVESGTRALAALCREAQCKDAAQLPDLEKRSDLYQTLKSDIVANENDITNVGDGLTIDELQAQAEQTDRDALPSAIEQLQKQIDSELAPRSKELSEVIGKQKNELEKMDGSAEAATLAESASFLLSSIRTNAEQYVRLKLAAKILRDHIEHFRQANQGPLLKRASVYFAQLTLNSFSGLMADFNDKDEQVLAGIRAKDDKQIPVEGMSSGSLDQLYLSLRLASLEKYALNAEPMPFIVDDVLIEFDDDRQLAALHCLAEMAKTTQIILFTHHSRLVDQAKAMKADVLIHAL